MTEDRAKFIEKHCTPERFYEMIAELNQLFNNTQGRAISKDLSLAAILITGDECLKMRDLIFGFYCKAYWEKEEQS